MIEGLVERRVRGAVDGEPETGAGGPAGAGGLVVGLARHRHEQRRDAERDQLVKGVVAGGADRGVEGGEVAAHRVGGAQLDHPSGTSPSAASAEESAATWTSSRPASRRRQRRVASPTSTPGRARRGRWSARRRARARRGALAGEQLGAVEEDDRPDPMGAVAQRHRRPAVLGLGQLARLEHRVEGAGAAERDPARARFQSGRRHQTAVASAGRAPSSAS